MNKLLSRAPIALALLALPALFAGEVTITVTPTLAPNAYGSPNWGAWEANAVAALTAGATSAGTPGTPSFYQAQDHVTAANSLVTDFNSWLGVADPAAPFNQEYGNRLTFGLSVFGNGTKISMSELGFLAVSSDDGNGLGLNYAAGGYDYSPNYIGIQNGADGIFGTSDDIVIDSGVNTQLVDEIFGRGSGNSYVASCPGCNAVDAQAAIDATAASITTTTFDGTYYLTNSTQAAAFASGTGEFTFTPEPGTWLMFASAAPALIWAKRRKKA